MSKYFFNTLQEVEIFFHFFPKYFPNVLMLLCAHIFHQIRAHCELERHLEKKIKCIKDVSETSWVYLSGYSNLSLHFLFFYEKYIDWGIFFSIKTNYITDKIMIHFSHHIDDYTWDYLSANRVFTNDCIRRFHKKIIWYEILHNQKVPEFLLRLYHEDFTKNDWYFLFKYQTISDKFLKDFHKFYNL